MKKLSEKWCIKITKENIEILSEWRTDNRLSSYNIGKYVMHEGYYTPRSHVRGYCEENKPLNCEEITFEEFKHFVLKEPGIIKEKKQDYSYLIKLFKKLKIT